MDLENFQKYDALNGVIKRLNNSIFWDIKPYSPFPFWLILRP
jgi:hypothetical protein